MHLGHTPNLIAICDLCQQSGYKRWTNSVQLFSCHNAQIQFMHAYCSHNEFCEHEHSWLFLCMVITDGLHWNKKPSWWQVCVCCIKICLRDGRWNIIKRAWTWLPWRQWKESQYACLTKYKWVEGWVQNNSHLRMYITSKFVVIDESHMRTWHAAI